MFMTRDYSCLASAESLRYVDVFWFLILSTAISPLCLQQWLEGRFTQRPRTHAVRRLTTFERQAVFNPRCSFLAYSRPPASFLASRYRWAQAALTPFLLAVPLNQGGLFKIKCIPNALVQDLPVTLNECRPKDAAVVTELCPLPGPSLGSLPASAVLVSLLFAPCGRQSPST